EGYAGMFRDISTGISSNDILAVGYQSIGYQVMGLGWNVIAYDNLTVGYCNSDDLVLYEYGHEYDIFDITTSGLMPRAPTPVHCIEPTETITNVVHCDKAEDEDGTGRKSPAMDMPANVSQDIQTGDVMVS